MSLSLNGMKLFRKIISTACGKQIFDSLLYDEGYSFEEARWILVKTYGLS